jgi:hypothetical protein
MRTARRSTRLAAGGLLAALALAGCTGQGGEPAPGSETTAAQPTAAETVEDVDPTDGGAAPPGMTAATDPKFAVGSTVDLTANHKPGMMGASATIVGAYDTTAYAISYTPTDGSPAVTNHKWIVHEELEGPPAEPAEPGDSVALTADGGESMQGAEATVDSAVGTTVYLVDIVMDGGTTLSNQWVVEGEIRPEGDPTPPPGTPTEPVTE